MFMRFLGGGIGHKGLRGIVRLQDTIQLIAKRAQLCTNGTEGMSFHSINLSFV